MRGRFEHVLEKLDYLQMLRINALELGSDYLLKPFGLCRFLARVRALSLRHVPPQLTEGV